ncbi:MAG: transporter substrate-binding domain-containing protein [Lachnospiraceae bacterium]|nr:transporter substrate-binding domain-containing protein [Lachnospiraceae bacterium]
MYQQIGCRIKAAFFIMVIAALLIAGSVTAFGGESGKADSLEDVIKEPIGEMMGSTYEMSAIENGTLPADVQMEFYNAEVDAVQALRDGKVGSYINCRIYAQPFIDEFDDLIIFPESLAVMEYAFGFQKGSLLRDEFNDAMKEMKESGEEQALYDKWLNGDSGETHCIEQDWTGEKGTLEYWLNVGTPPMAYISEGGKIEGLAIDYVLTACRIMGYNVNITECSFSGLIPALQSDRADIAGRSMAVTEERKKSIDFSDTFVSADVVLLVRKDSVSDAVLAKAGAGNADGEAKEGFLESIKEDFRKTFIEENRWGLFASGIGVTLLITLCSGIIGTLFGLLWYLLYSRNIKWVNVIIMTVNRWISGIPAVVILMIMYYIVFSLSSLDAIGIAVITFAILFGIGVFGLLEAGVEAIGKGQVESAVDLGFTQTQTFWKILLPQAALYALPLYRAKVVEHLKSTAIVGYIAIMDLTKVCDMVRSRTFEAFFPLIATAVLYYLLGRLLDAILSGIEKMLKSENRESRIMRGVKQDD